MALLALKSEKVSTCPAFSEFPKIVDTLALFQNDVALLTLALLTWHLDVGTFAEKVPTGLVLKKCQRLRGCRKKVPTGP